MGGVGQLVQTGLCVLGAGEGTLRIIQNHAHFLYEETEGEGVKSWAQLPNFLSFLHYFNRIYCYGHKPHLGMSSSFFFFCLGFYLSI